MHHESRPQGANLLSPLDYLKYIWLLRSFQVLALAGILLVSGNLFAVFSSVTTAGVEMRMVPLHTFSALLLLLSPVIGTSWIDISSRLLLSFQMILEMVARNSEQVFCLCDPILFWPHPRASRSNFTLAGASSAIACEIGALSFVSILPIFLSSSRRWLFGQEH